jgi:hypothetical protein
MTIVGFTGTRQGMTSHQYALVVELLDKPGIESAHHGDCIGADAQFHHLCLSRNIPIVVHPPSDDKLRAWCPGAAEYKPERAYLDRNRDIVRECTLLVAAPYEFEEPSHPRGKGAWFTVRYANNIGRITMVIPPAPPKPLGRQLHQARLRGFKDDS